MCMLYAYVCIYIYSCLFICYHVGYFCCVTKEGRPHVLCIVVNVVPAEFPLTFGYVVSGRFRCERVKMADSVAAGVGEEKETENEDKEREKRAFNNTNRSENSGGPSEVTETLGFYERNANKKDKKRNLSGECNLRPL